MAAFISATKLTQLLARENLDGSLLVSILGVNRLALGNNPLKPTSVLDFSEEAVFPYKEIVAGSKVDPADAPDAKVGRVPRRSGNYWFELKGRRIECPSLKELLARSLRHFEHLQPGTLEQLAAVKSRSRRIVAHNPRELYNKEHLVKDHSEKLATGWWYGTNNSAQQTETWLKHACEIAGLTWGDDFRVSFS